MSRRPRRERTGGAGRGPAHGRRRALAPALGAALAMAAGCGWNQGYLATPGAPDATTVGVELFDNESPEPGLEARLAPHLSEALVDWVGLDLETPGRADLVIRGTVLDLRRRGGVRSKDNELLGASTRIEVSASLERRSDGEILATTTSGLWADWAVGGAALSGPGLGEDRARDRLLGNLADRIVLDLFAAAADEGEDAGDGGPGEPGGQPAGDPVGPR